MLILDDDMVVYRKKQTKHIGIIGIIPISLSGPHTFNNDYIKKIIDKKEVVAGDVKGFKAVKWKVRVDLRECANSLCDHPLYKALTEPNLTLAKPLQQRHQSL